MTVRSLLRATPLLVALLASSRGEQPADSPAPPAPPSGVQSGRAPRNDDASPTSVGRYFADKPAGLKKNECPLLPAVERALLMADDVTDCGSLPRYAPTSMLQRAQRCVLEAQRAGKAFRVMYLPASYDTLESGAFVSPGATERPVSLHRTSTPTAPWEMRAELRSYTCGALREREACAFESGDLCLDCLDGQRRAAPCERMETF